MLKIGSVLDGKYTILKKVGEGGMSVVYLAIEEGANRIWAVKELCSDRMPNYSGDKIVDWSRVPTGILVDDPHDTPAKRKLVEEATLMSRLDNPHVPRVVDLIDEGDSFFVVMDFVEGFDLEKWADGPQPEAEVIEWSKQICEALHYLHTRKPPIIYHDMKPANVMLRPDGQIMLIDFNAARECDPTDPGVGSTGILPYAEILGTRGYAAPEQYSGRQVDARADVYGLGATMYRLITGRTPYCGMRPIREINSKLSRGLEEIIQKCTRENPDERYQNCLELMEALDHIGEIDDSRRRKLRTKYLCIGAAAALAGVGVGILLAKADAKEKLRKRLFYNDLDG